MENILNYAGLESLYFRVIYACPCDLLITKQRRTSNGARVRIRHRKFLYDSPLHSIVPNNIGSYRKRKREIDRERERQKERQTDRGRQRETGRERHGEEKKIVIISNNISN